jgi:hypothetical protein
MKVSAQYAEEHFTDILVTAKSGEDVVIGCPDDSSFRLTLMPAVSKPAAHRPRRDLLGAGEGMITLPSDEDWKTMDNEFAAEILNTPIFPPEQ